MRFVRRLGGWDELDSVEAPCLGYRAGADQVPVVNGVEGAAEAEGRHSVGLVTDGETNLPITDGTNFACIGQFPPDRGGALEKKVSSKKWKRADS